MIDIDLGPVIQAAIISFYVIPGFVGLLVGLAIGLIICHLKSFVATKRFTTIATCMVIGLIAFPLITIELSGLFDRYQNHLFQVKKDAFSNKNLNSFKLYRLAFENHKYQLTFDVPKEGSYYIFAAGYKNRQIVARVTTKKFYLSSGPNTISIPVEVSSLETDYPLEFEFEIWNSDTNRDLKNDRQGLIVTNQGATEAREGMHYYSPYLDTNPCAFESLLPCTSTPILHFTLP